MAPRAILCWDVKIPPAKKRMVKGRLIVSTGVMVQRLRRKPRRITIEIHGDDNNENSIRSNNNTSPIRSSSTRSQSQTANFATKISSMINRKLGEDEMVFIRILRHPRKSHDSDEEDDEDEHGIIDEQSLSHNQNIWAEYKRYVLDDVVVVKKLKYSIDLKLGRGHETEVRNVIFDTEKEVTSFCTEIDYLIKQRDIRASGLLSTFRHSSWKLGKSVDGLYVQGDSLKILVEIVAAYNLPEREGLRKTDPYVNVFMGPQQVHKTDYIPRSLNPIWTILTGGIFLLETTTDEFFHSDGMTFIVMDFESVSRDNRVGRVTINHSHILQGRGDRREFPLYSENDSPIFGSKIVLRFRPATKSDIVFIKEFKSKPKGATGVRSKEAFTPPIRISNNLSQALRSGSRKNAAGIMEYRVKPCPDPARKDSTTWMTEDEIEIESRKPSQKWIEVGSGNLGRVYFEILGCDGLPNLDNAFGGKDDCFACIVFEDAVVNSEVIVDSNSPRWMPWTQRAFIFNVDHPTSQILLGIFDHDKTTAISTHDPIGRVAVDITNLRPQTEYTLTYNLYTSGHVDAHDPVGTIVVRLRTQWHSVPGIYLKSFTFPQKNYVNTFKKHDFRTTHFAVVGKENIYDFDTDVLNSYTHELLALIDVLHYVKIAAVTVFLWRGHFQCSFPLPWFQRDRDYRNGTGLQPARLHCNLPLHSIFAFTTSAMLVENYNLLPSFFFFSIAWLFLATSDYNRRHPSPWMKPRSIKSMYSSLLTGHIEKAYIEEYENAEEGEAFEAQEKAEIEASRFIQTDSSNKTEEHIVKELTKEEEELRKMDSFDDNIATKKNKMSLLTPLKHILLPIQLNLGKIIVVLRVVKSLVSWEASYYAFFIFNFSILTGVLLLFVPWDIIFRWTLRIIVWGSLGPQMKLVDHYYVRKYQRNEEQRRADEYANQTIAIISAKRILHIKNEKAVKLKDMKHYMFGKFIVEVPRFKEYRYRDVPLAKSFAVPFSDDEDVPPERIIATKKGQYLLGDMIPIWAKRHNDWQKSLSTKRIQTARRQKPEPRHRYNVQFSENEQTSLMSSPKGAHTGRYDTDTDFTTPSERHTNLAVPTQMMNNNIQSFFPTWGRDEGKTEEDNYVEV